MLSYQKLDVYKCAIQFVALAAKLIVKIPRGYSFLSDELKRAAVSMPQNIAEGVGKKSAIDRSHYLAIARGSAMECGSVLDVGVVFKLFSDSDREPWQPSAGTYRVDAIQDDGVKLMAYLSSMSR